MSTMRWTAAAAAIVLLGASGVPAQPFLGPTHYLCFDASTTTATGDCGPYDSPFANLVFAWFHFKDYEDEILDSPGVTVTTADCPRVGVGCPLISTDWFPDFLTDSVDEDDGAIDGLGQTVAGRGRSVWGKTYLDFAFDPAVLGSLPTHAGVVWTDGGIGATEFEAWDENGTSLGTLVATLADGSNYGTTAEDAFLGVIHPGGISAIRVTNAEGGIEIDHLQYGYALSGGFLPVAIVVDAPGDGCIHLHRSAVTVTLLGQPGLDVDDVLLGSLRFNGLRVQTTGSNQPRCSRVAANLDASPDLECRFDVNAQAWSGDEALGTLTGVTSDARGIQGATAICTKH